jgi:prevent-host-death family protein
MEGEMASQAMRQWRAISTTEVRRNLNAVIQRLRRRREHAIIEQSGAPVAVLLPIAEYMQLLRYRRLAVFDRFTREFGEQVERRGVSEDELIAELEETKREVFREKYAQLA